MPRCCFACRGLGVARSDSHCWVGDTGCGGDAGRGGGTRPLDTTVADAVRAGGGDGRNLRAERGDGVAAASDILLASEPTGKLGVVTATALATDWFAVEATAETTFGGGVIASVSSSEIDDDIRCSQAAAGPKAASPGSATATAGDGGGATSEPARTGVREELRPSGAFPGTGLSTAGCDISAAAAGGSWLVLASPSDV